MPRYMIRFLIISMASVLSFSACTKNSDESTINLSEQYGLAYAPVTVARLKGWFEQEMPGEKISWTVTGNAAAVREAVLAERLDGGFMGIPPYLIAKDRGMEWTAVGGIAEARLGLTTVRSGIVDVTDIPSNMRIALPQPGSIQHILLSMAADRELGDSKRFDGSLVSLSHPDGMSALLSGTEVEGHFTSPPYLQRELESPRVSLVLDGNDAFGGDFTFIVFVLSDNFIKDRPETVDALRRVLLRSSTWINAHPAEAALMLADHYRMDAEELEKILRSREVHFGPEIKGMKQFRQFMHKTGLLRNGEDTSAPVVP